MPSSKKNRGTSEDMSEFNSKLANTATNRYQTDNPSVSPSETERWKLRNPKQGPSNPAQVWSPLLHTLNRDPDSDGS